MIHIITSSTRLPSLALVFCVCLITAQVHANVPSVKLGGYIKLDAMFSDFSAGELASGNLARDFYLPALIPTGNADGAQYLDFTARTSRFNLTTVHEMDGKKVSGFVEFDFMTGVDGDERATNGYKPTLRHVFFSYEKWLFGQTWSVFQNVGALPETLDYVGPVGGTIFVRQPQIRFTNGAWQFSVENPETTLTNNTGGRIVTGSGITPDFVGRYSFSGDWGGVVIAALLRNLAYENAAADIDESELGYGISLSGKINTGGGNDLRFMLTHGSGIGRYIALNLVNDAALDAGNGLDNIDVTSAMLSYRMLWNAQWRSNLSLSMFSADHDTALTGETVTKTVQSIHLNLLHSPVAKVTLGGELIYAKRELASGADGTMTRLQFSARYDL